MDRFDPEDLVGLPSPARRLLGSVLTPGVVFGPTAVLEMHGEIKLGSWLPFRARQVLRVGAGFVWEARVGRGPVVFTGGDTLWRGRGSLDFRLWGLVPVARATGHDVTRSAIGRLAAETVVWAPQGLTPAMGATWTGLDDGRAVVTLPIGGAAVDVTVDVDDDGRLRELSLQRWGDPDGSFRWVSFGAACSDHHRFDGITIATTGEVGWGWDQPEPSRSFRYALDHATFPHSSPAGGRDAS